MAEPLTPDAAAALRARLHFLRDLGVYDLYRRGAGLTSEALRPPSEPRALVPAAEAVELRSPPPESLPPGAASARHAIDASPTNSPEELAIARRREQPKWPPETFPHPPLEPGRRDAALRAIRAEIGDCTRCALAFMGRHTIVFGDGDPNASLVFVGEGPGADEDKQGLPFVGKAGQLLNNMIAAMGLQREAVYIANIVKCRPPGNRIPEPSEANTCTQFLFQQLGVVRPRVIVALGSTAATYLLGERRPLAGLRGTAHPYLGAKLIVTYHPAFLLRDPAQKKEAWADLQIAMRELRAGAPPAP